MELLDERWTLLVVRELLMGSQRFNDLRRGTPRMSPTLLSRRLQQLVRAGVVERRMTGDEVRYVLTPAGEELRPVVESLGAWGVRWIGEIGEADLDPKLLLWDMHRNVERSLLPAGRTVVAFQFPRLPAAQRDWWMVLEADDVDICDEDPGHPVTVTLTADLRALTLVWRGDLAWSSALRTGAVHLAGPAAVRRALPSWFTLSAFAGVPRPAKPAGIAG
jgi:DNA-binding HxlR family transcriptional regulator